MLLFSGKVQIHYRRPEEYSSDDYDSSDPSEDQHQHHHHKKTKSVVARGRGDVFLNVGQDRRLPPYDGFMYPMRNRRLGEGLLGVVNVLNSDRKNRTMLYEEIEDEVKDKLRSMKNKIKAEEKLIKRLAPEGKPSYMPMIPVQQPSAEVTSSEAELTARDEMIRFAYSLDRGLKRFLYGEVSDFTDVVMGKDNKSFFPLNTIFKTMFDGRGAALAAAELGRAIRARANSTKLPATKTILINTASMVEDHLTGLANSFNSPNLISSMTKRMKAEVNNYKAGTSSVGRFFSKLGLSFRAIFSSKAKKRLDFLNWCEADLPLIASLLEKGDGADKNRIAVLLRQFEKMLTSVSPIVKKGSGDLDEMLSHVATAADSTRSFCYRIAIKRTTDALNWQQFNLAFVESLKAAPTEMQSVLNEYAKKNKDKLDGLSQDMLATWGDVAGSLQQNSKDPILLNAIVATGKTVSEHHRQFAEINERRDKMMNSLSDTIDFSLASLHAIEELVNTNGYGNNLTLSQYGVLGAYIKSETAQSLSAIETLAGAIEASGASSKEVLFNRLNNLILSHMCDKDGKAIALESNPTSTFGNNSLARHLMESTEGHFKSIPSFHDAFTKFQEAQREGKVDQLKDKGAVIIAKLIAKDKLAESKEMTALNAQVKQFIATKEALLNLISQRAKQRGAEGVEERTKNMVSAAKLMKEKTILKDLKAKKHKGANGAGHGAGHGAGGSPKGKGRDPKNDDKDSQDQGHGPQGGGAARVLNFGVGAGGNQSNGQRQPQKQGGQPDTQNAQAAQAQQAAQNNANAADRPLVIPFGANLNIPLGNPMATNPAANVATNAAHNTAPRAAANANAHANGNPTNATNPAASGQALNGGASPRLGPAGAAQSFARGNNPSRLLRGPNGRPQGPQKSLPSNSGMRKV